MILKRSPNDASGMSVLLRVSLGTLVVVFVLGATFLGGIFTHRQGLIKSGRTLVEKWTSRSYLNSLTAPALPELIIDMKFSHLEKVRAKREEALQRGILVASDDDFVPAQLRWEGRTIPVKMRLKGDTRAHFTTDKWSFRIKVKGEEQVMGMRRFSIQHPQTRNYLSEWGFLENLRKEGVLVPRYRFVNVTFNGDSKGIYALEEFFAKEMVEAQRRREGVFVVFNDDLFWSRREQLGPWNNSLASIFDPLDYRNMLIKVYQPTRTQNDPTLASERDEALRMLRGFQQGTLRPSEIFDIRLMARYLAVTELWSAGHGLEEEDSVLYYNPISGKLEPVGFDSKPSILPQGAPTRKPPHSLVALEPKSTRLTSWTRTLLEDPEVARAYVQELRRITSEGYLLDLEESIGEGLERNLRALHREWPELIAPWNDLRKRQAHLRAIIDPPTVVQALQLPSTSGLNGETLEAALGSAAIEVANLFALPVEVIGFRVGDGPPIPAADVLVDSGSPAILATDEQSVILWSKAGDDPLAFVDFSVPVPVNTAPTGPGSAAPILVLNRLLGESEVRETPVTPYVSIASDTAIPGAPTVEQALALHPGLELTGDPLMLRISPGVWNIERDLVLPDNFGLYIGPGTTLRFAPDAILLARGPLVFHGTAEEPIILGPSGASWAGVAVLGAEEPSFWQHVLVENTDGIERGGWILTGGITFYESPITLYRTRIVGSSAEDAINIVRTTFQFYETEIANAASDGFDGDFTEGTIAKTNFHDIGGDAIDVSGSTVTVEDTVVRNVGDKAVSVGESSRVEVIRLVSDNVGIGVASKDLSQVSITDSTISSFVNAGLVAFTKKPVYGPASIIANNVILQGKGEPLLIQTGSWIRLDGEYFSGTDLDVGALYDAGVTGQLAQSLNR